MEYRPAWRGPDAGPDAAAANGGNCVETASADGAILVRDTKHRDGAVLTIPADAWRRLLAKQR
jgi:Domain of unknown function (DUF397)